MTASKKVSVAEQYLRLKEKHKSELVFFQIGEFYELLFDDAVKASQLLNITLTKRGKHREQDVPLCGIPRHASNIYVNKLLKQNYKVALYEQTEDYQNFVDIGLEKRRLKRVFTPGTVLDDDLLLSNKNNFIVCLYGSDEFGACVVDISTGEVFCKSVKANELDSFLTQWEPVEILLEKNINATVKVDLDDILYTWKARITYIEQDFFQTADTIFVDFFQGIEAVQSAIGVLSDNAKIAFKGLLQYVQYTKSLPQKQLQIPRVLLDQEFLYISKNSRINLELAQTTLGDKTGSLLQILNNTVTSFGSRWMTKQLNAPLTSQREIERRLDYVSFFLGKKELSDKIVSVLEQMTDLERCAYRISVDSYKKTDFINVLDALKHTKSILELIKNEHEKCELLDHLILLKPYVDELYYAFNQSITDDINNLINKEKNEMFGRVWCEYEMLKSKLNDLEQIYRDELGEKTLKIKYQAGLGNFIEVPNKHIAKVPFSFNLMQNLSNAKRYSTQALDDLNIKLNQSITKMNSIEDEVVKKLQQMLVQKKKVVNGICVVLGKIDTFISFANTARVYGFVRPQFVSRICLDVIQGYHLAIASNKVRFKSNDCKLNDQQKVMFLSGPNMSGKSTYMRQNAQIIVLAQMGSFVPAKGVVMNITDAIYTRIGAYDDISHGKSTFMCEMIELSDILRKATKNSLIILDEIGRGTTPREGQAIAQAVLENILKNEVRTIFATHFGGIGLRMNDAGSKIMCKQMLAKTNGLMQIEYLYELIDGISNYSYGIAVAKQAGLDDGIIRRAMSLIEDK